MSYIDFNLNGSAEFSFTSEVQDLGSVGCTVNAVCDRGAFYIDTIDILGKEFCCTEMRDWIGQPQIDEWLSEADAHWNEIAARDAYARDRECGSAAFA